LQLNSIQALRGFAAISVLIAHLAGIEVKYAQDTLLPVWFQIGFSGVDLFFVISGFVMVYVTREKLGQPAALPEFVFARVWRIYPVYWLYTCFGMLAFLVLYGLPWDPTDLGQRDGIGHLLASFALWPQDGLPVLITGWTLVHEMYFYLVFALLLLVPSRHVPVALGVWAGLVFAGGALGWGSYSALAALVFHPLTYEFLLGATVGLFWVKGARWPALPCLMVALAWLVAVFFLLPLSRPGGFPSGLERVLAFGPPSALLIMAALAFERDKGWQVPRWMIRLGDWSYSLYLSHILVLSAIARFFWTPLMTPGPLDNLLAHLTMAAASIVFAGLAYRLFEAPVMAAGRWMRITAFRTNKAG
jgi:exopolysaccharide production protein ExoZ